MSAEQQALWVEETLPYHRPSMDEIRAIPWNGLSAVGSFSGAGGSSLGLRIAGFRVPYAIEFVPAAADAYEANSTAYVDRRDIRNISGVEILSRLGLFRGQLDLFEGSPPCASWSLAGAGEKYRDHKCEACKGAREIPSLLTGQYEKCEACEGQGSFEGSSKPYSDTKQRTDDLFDQYIRLVRELHPRAFVAENVPGMIQGATVESYTHLVTTQLTELGYRVWAKVLNAANYGVPQERKRLIFVGLRKDQGSEWKWPPDEHYRFSLRAALGSVDPEDPDHALFLAESSMGRFAVGRAWEIATGRRVLGSCLACGGLLRPRLESDERCGCAEPQEAKQYFMLTVPKLDEPSPTLTATAAQVGAASLVHPEECRKLTPAECKAICGFPPDFVLTGTREQRVERMGRAVPPPFMAAVGRYVRDALS